MTVYDKDGNETLVFDRTIGIVGSKDGVQPKEAHIFVPPSADILGYYHLHGVENDLLGYEKVRDYGLNKWIKLDYDSEFFSNKKYNYSNLGILIYKPTGDIPFSKVNNKPLSVGTPGDKDNKSSAWNYSPHSNQVEYLGELENFRDKNLNWSIEENNGIKYIKLKK
jgi:hypothetical protein